MNQNNVMGLDVGGRRIGVAVASMQARLAAPVGFIDRQKQPDAVAAIKELMTKHNISTVVVGLPRGMDGQETEQTAITREFAAELSAVIQQPVTMQDEAGTSKLAQEYLDQRRKPYDKGDIDAEAAAIILRDWLNQSVEHTA